MNNNLEQRIIKALRPSFAELLSDPYYYETYDSMLDHIQRIFFEKELTQAIKQINILLQRHTSYKPEYNALLDVACSLEENDVKYKHVFKY